MKSRTKAIVVAVLVLTAGVGAYCYRNILRVKAWHYKNGNFLVVGTYNVFVPDMWYAKEIGEENALLVCPGCTGDGKFASIASISVTHPVNDLKFWEMREKESFQSSQVQILTLSTASGEEVRCVQGHFVRDVLEVRESPLISASCQSKGRLNLIFTGRGQALLELQEIIKRTRAM